MIDLFLKEFYALCAIPRPSGKEEAVCAYLAGELRSMGLRPELDAHLNLVCDVPPTDGVQGTPPLALQAHTDMVCVGAADYVPERDPVRTEIRDGWLCSDGRSTLGADCGAGIAAVMALLRSGAPHGALRLIFTADEEMGLVGARAIAPDVVRDCVGLINLDGFHGDRAVISSAGGYRLIFDRRVSMVPSTLDAAYRISVRGLRGGHSGDDIGEGRANAARLLLWLLRAVELPFELAALEAKGAFNVIRTQGDVTILVQQSHRAHLAEIVDLFREGIEALYHETDPDIRITLEATEVPPEVFPPQEVENLLSLAGVIPCGVDEMHPICLDCVGSSGNLASLYARDGFLEVRSFMRSCSNTYLDEHGAYYRTAGREFGYREEEMRYPAWPGDPENPMAKRCIEIAARQGREMTIGAVHAGLETSVFHMLRPDMPVISLGGDILDPHTVQERLRLSSASALMELLREMILPVNHTPDPAPGDEPSAEDLIMTTETGKSTPFIDSSLRHILRVPEACYQCSGIVINGRWIKSFVFTTDIAIIRNCNADAVFAVYPFTPQQAISGAIINAAYVPVFCGVGGGTTKGLRTVILAKDVESQGAMGVVLNAPVSDVNIRAVKRVVDIPVIITVVSENTDIRARLRAGADILNVAGGPDTPEIVEKIRKAYPDVPIIASGGNRPDTIERTIRAGANAITYTPPSTKELFSAMMAKYREM